VSYGTDGVPARVAALTVMAQQTIGIIVHGATGRIGSTQHLANALVPIIAEGGLPIGPDRLLPRVLLVGRNSDRLAAVARGHNLSDWTTDLGGALASQAHSVFFDAAATAQRLPTLERALAAGKHVYSEKPLAPSTAEGMALLRDAQARGLKHGVVEDKLGLPGLRRLAEFVRAGELGRIIGFRLEFGWWIFDGTDRPSQRSSWNYQQGGGLIFDMYPHWRYVIEGIVGRILRVTSTHWTATPERIDENGASYRVPVEDSAATLVEIEGGVFGTINSSWATRVRRDDLFTLHVDGSQASVLATLHRCYVQRASETPTIPHFNIAKDLRTDYRNDWTELPSPGPGVNPYRVGWEQFLRHVAADAPLTSDFAAGIRDVAFAEACRRSMAERAWVAMPPA
jgi:predicted dehydrogenase